MDWCSRFIAGWTVHYTIACMWLRPAPTSLLLIRLSGLDDLLMADDGPASSPP